MAKAKEEKAKVEDIKVTDAVVVKAKKKVVTQAYPLKIRQNVRGKWLEKGDKINLTKEGYNLFHSQKIV